MNNVKCGDGFSATGEYSRAQHYQVQQSLPLSGRAELDITMYNKAKHFQVQQSSTLPGTAELDTFMNTIAHNYVVQAESTLLGIAGLTKLNTTRYSRVQHFQVELSTLNVLRARRV